MEKLPPENLFRPFLEKNNGVLDASVMDAFLNMMWDSIDDPVFYKLLRKEVESLHKIIPDQDTIINQESP